MAVLVTADIPGGTLEKDEELSAEMRSRENPPVGLLFRAAGPIPGGWRITSGWETREAFDQFYKDRLMAAATKVGAEPAQITVSELASFRLLPPR